MNYRLLVVVIHNQDLKLQCHQHHRHEARVRKEWTNNRAPSFGTDSSQSHEHSLSSFGSDGYDHDDRDDRDDRETHINNRISINSVNSINSYDENEDNNSNENDENESSDSKNDKNNKGINRKLSWANKSRNFKSGKNSTKRKRHAQLSDILTNEGTFDLFMCHLSKEFSIEIMLAFVEFIQYELFVRNNLKILKILIHKKN